MESLSVLAEESDSSPAKAGMWATSNLFHRDWTPLRNACCMFFNTGAR